MQSQFEVCKPACSYPQSTSKAKTHENLLTKDRSRDEKQCCTPSLHQMHLCLAEHRWNADASCVNAFFIYVFSDYTVV